LSVEMWIDGILKISTYFLSFRALSFRALSFRRNLSYRAFCHSLGIFGTVQ
jgi:hypothetical protein